MTVNTYSGKLTNTKDKNEKVMVMMDVFDNGDIIQITMKLPDGRTKIIISE